MACVYGMLAWYLVGGREDVGGVSVLFLVLLYGYAFLCTRRFDVANMIASGGLGRPVVNTDMIIGNAAGKAIASLSKGFAVRTSGDDILVISFVKCAPRRFAVGNGRAFCRVSLTRSARALSRIIMMNFNARGGIGLAKTITAISGGALRSHPIASISRTLRKIVPKLGVSVGSGNKQLSCGPAVGVHKAKGLGAKSDTSPLILVSKTRKSVGSLGPRSVTGVSILGSTTTSTVCNSHTPFNMVLIAAGSKRTKGTAVRCSGGFE